MDYKLTKGQNSNYEVELTVMNEEFASYKDVVLKNFQKDMKVDGFRPGKVPLDMVEKSVKPEYLNVGIYEEAIHNGIDKILQENADLKLIGQIYDLNHSSKEDKAVITFKIDEYPEVAVLNDNWKSLSMSKIDDTASEEEIEKTLNNLRKQYATYEDTDCVDNNCVFKIKMEYKDGEGNIIDSGKIMLGEEELQEHKDLTTMFFGKKVGDKLEQTYDSKSLPLVLQSLKKELNPSKVEFEILEIKQVMLPDMNEENIKKLFNNENVENLEQLKERIAELIVSQKRESLIMQGIDELLESAKTSLQVSVPMTIVKDEIDSRIKSLQERFGGEAAFNEYLNKAGEESKNQMIQELSSAAKISLEKFFIFRKYIELLGLEKEIDWNVPMNAELKVYEKIAK
ncbi:MAG: trigger factor [Candidatus Absconditabacteria bacterium]